MYSHFFLLPEVGRLAYWVYFFNQNDWSVIFIQMIWFARFSYVFILALCFLGFLWELLLLIVMWGLVYTSPAKVIFIRCCRWLIMAAWFQVSWKPSSDFKMSQKPIHFRWITPHWLHILWNSFSCYFLVSSHIS